MNRTKMTIGLLLIGMLATSVTACGRNNDDNNDNNTTNSTTPNNNTSEATNAIQADDQTLEDATKVTVASVTADVDGFVVIHEDDDGPGAVIGFAAVSAGATTDLEITLDRDAVDGETLHAMLHVDDPADGEYKFGEADGEDGPAVDKDGEVVVDSFKVSIEGEEPITPDVEVVNQTLALATEVNIAKVTAAADGYIVIHEVDENGALVVEPAIGFAAVTTGDNTNVKVTLTRPAVDGETLHAMLHTEDNGNTTYDGPATDAPVLGEDEMVIAPSFTVTVPAEGPTPSVTVADQTLSRDAADKVSIAEVVAAVDGYIVIHEADENGDLVVDPAIGFAAVTAGTNTDVEVTLTRPAEEGETLFAMLHTEDSGNDTYDGPAADAPVLDENDMIITPSFTVSFELLDGVTVNDQSADPANEVTIAQVNAVAKGYIVIHAQDADGNLIVEPAIGSAPVSVGGNTDITVTLDRPVIDGETLYAMLHTEDSGNDTYDGPAADAPVTDSNGDIITPAFTVSAGTSAPFVTVEDQFVDPVDEVIIKQTIYADAGWIVIHEDGGAGFGDVIGKTQLTAGVNQDVVVKLDRNVVTGEKLYAMLHSDDGDGVYEFPGADAPVMDAAGQLVNPTFIATTPENSVTVADQTLSNVSTIVTVDESYALLAGYIVIHEDDGAGGIGGMIGVAPVSKGLNGSLDIELARPLTDGETIYAMLHTEDNGNTTYDGAATDAPATDSSGNVVTPAFTVTVPAGTPAIIFVMNSMGSTDYLFDSVIPARFATEVGSGGDPTLTLRQNWRYKFDLSTNTLSTHPIQFGEAGGVLGADNWVLSQGNEGDATFESDAGINWVDAGGDVAFTVTSLLAAELVEYNCANHAGMLGNITVVTP